jgi:hypothetical protein
LRVSEATTMRLDQLGRISPHVLRHCCQLPRKSLGHKNRHAGAWSTAALPAFEAGPSQHHRILRAIDKHIPVDDVMSIDEVACRLDKVQQQPTVAHKLGQEIKYEIQTQVGECLTSSIGISANKLLAKLASNMTSQLLADSTIGHEP